MNILTTVYYKDYARYFDYVESCLANFINKTIDFYYISYYPSAHAYLKRRGKDSVLLPAEIGNKKRINNLDDEIYKGVNISQVINFNYQAQLIYDVDQKKNLCSIALNYVDYFEKLFLVRKFDFMISSGDTRMATEIAIIFAKRNNIPIIYFEQGPFGTTIFDKEGVNCNITFSPSINELNEKQRQELYKRISMKTYNKVSKIWSDNEFRKKDRLSDLKTRLWLYPPKPLRKFFPVDSQIGRFFLNKKKKKDKNEELRIDESKLSDNYIALFLQVPVDAQLIENSPLYKDFFSIVEDVYNSMPKGYELIIREHPNNIGRYDRQIYSFVSEKKGVSINNRIPFNELIENSKVVVVNNSTVGIEALAKMKPVVTLGNAYYNWDQVTYHVGEKQMLPKILNDALLKKVDINKVECALYDFIFNFLYEGHFQNLHLQFDAKRFVDDFLKDRKN